MRTRWLSIALAGVSVLSFTLAPPQKALGAPAPGTALTTVEFDEIDHVYTGSDVPQPGSFSRDVALVVRPAPPQQPPKKRFDIFGALTSASNVLGGVGSVISSGGALSSAIGIAHAATAIAPFTDMLGLAGGRRFDTLIANHILPRISPTNAELFKGFLAAKADATQRLGLGRPNAGAAGPPQQTPEAAVAPYASGVLKHYVIASNGWARIDDPATKTTVIIKPDRGQRYIIDPAAKTVRVAPYAAPAADSASGAQTGGSATVVETTEDLGATTLEGLGAQGYRTRASVRVQPSGAGCSEGTISSLRVEYFAPLRDPSGVASRGVGSSPSDGASETCLKSARVAHSGPQVPADQIVLYQANTIEKNITGPNGAGAEHYTLLLERGNIREGTVDPGAFEIPAGYAQVAER